MDNFALASALATAISAVAAAWVILECDGEPEDKTAVPLSWGRWDH